MLNENCGMLSMNVALKFVCFGIIKWMFDFDLSCIMIDESMNNKQICLHKKSTFLNDLKTLNCTAMMMDLCMDCLQLMDS